MIHFERIGPDQDSVLQSLYEHYVHDMSEWLGIEVHADGRYNYDTSPFWKGDFAVFLAKTEETLVGFAVVQSGEKWLGATSSRDVKDFFVLRAHRRKSIADEMARFIWNQFPAQWIVRVLPTNRPALPFWRRMVNNYTNSKFEELNANENGRDWVHLHFDNSPSAKAR